MICFLRTFAFALPIDRSTRASVHHLDLASPSGANVVDSTDYQPVAAATFRSSKRHQHFRELPEDGNRRQRNLVSGDSVPRLKVVADLPVTVDLYSDANAGAILHNCITYDFLLLLAWIPPTTLLALLLLHTVRLD